MSDTQHITIQHRGCGFGCLPVILVLGVLGLAYEYWYVTVPTLLAAGVVYLWMNPDRLAGLPGAPTDDEPARADGGWEPDPVDPENTERWRQAGEWTGATRPRGRA